MKTLHTVTDPSQFPTFWNEKWLKKAISEVDLRAMTPDQKMAYEMVLSANALVVKNENKKIKEARETENLAVKTETVRKMLLADKFSLDEIADFNSIPIDFVIKAQQKLPIKK